MSRRKQRSKRVDEKMTVNEKYFKKLRSKLLAPGEGCHPSLLGAANVGALAGLSEYDAFAGIRAFIPPGKRQVPDQEIIAAIHKAYADHNPQTGKKYLRPQKPEPIIRCGRTALQRIVEQSIISGEADLWESSPIRHDWPPENDSANFLFSMFAHDDLIFIGDRLEPGIVGQNIRPVADWINHFQAGGRPAPFVVVNPLTGRPAPKKSGDGDTFRGDGNIKRFRYCLAEFDNLTFEEQIRFWTAAKLPIAALIDSGNKSLHAWIKLSNINSIDDWQREIKQRLYELGLIPLGVDSACSNPSRLSRLPGHLRDTGNFQKILWLAAPEKDGF